MLHRHASTKKQGDTGMGLAIGWFTSHGYTVSIPLTDSQDYDLIVDNGTGLKRVQVKTTTFQVTPGVYQANLSVKGGNRTSKGTVKKFDSTRVEILFIATGDSGLYLVPSDRVGQFGINLGKSYADCRVSW